ncbi:dockerin type I domain-containing protein [Mucisphaera calidilacus]|uniref:dockerin type I domain-containing protein n=1 Tax=Mucisphaera calidilacus TaxID=2527982 RepID=UPI0011A1C7E6|nr:dockerin type I domain-containing protein [Mucisphaera calidilacus]
MTITAGTASAEIDHVVLDTPIVVQPGFTQQLELDGLPIFDPEDPANEGVAPPFDIFVNHWFAPDFTTYYEVNIRAFPGTVLVNGQSETVTYFPGTGSEQTQTYNLLDKLDIGQAIGPQTVGQIGSEFRGVLALNGAGAGEFYVPNGQSVTGMVGLSFVGIDSPPDERENRRVNYAWVEFTINAAPAGTGLGELVINQWAYETEYGRPILAGETSISLQKGDFDASGDLGQGDLDYMLSILGNNPLGEDDFNDDGAITMDDVDLWIVEALGSTAGDANFDGSVDLLDLSLLASNFDTPSGASWGDGDFNFDGAVNLLDLSALASNFETSPAPEPTTALLSLLGLAAIARRR